MWTVLTTERFDEWFNTLDGDTKVAVFSTIGLLKAKGPLLSRPYADSLYGSKRVSNLKELRIQHKGLPLRAFFAFDPQRQAILLCGGDKSNDKRFYEKMIAIAEQEFIDYLDGLE